MSTKGMKIIRLGKTPIIRFEERYIPEPNSGCWLWTGILFKSGYGWFSVHSKVWRAHRWAYEHLVGPIPDGMVLDHLCKVKSCVNPDHLEPVTQKVNMERAKTGKYKPFCKNGHPRSGDNLYFFPNGARACRECVRISVRKYQKRKKGERYGGSYC
jgi:hypothetical protein